MTSPRMSTTRPRRRVALEVTLAVCALMAFGPLAGAQDLPSPEPDSARADVLEESPPVEGEPAPGELGPVAEPLPAPRPLPPPAPARPVEAPASTLVEAELVPDSEPAPAQVSVEEHPVPLLEPDPIQHNFGFGSYGRAGVGTDLQGSTGRPISVVSHGPRVVETPYLELDFYYDVTTSGPWSVRTVTTLAFTEDLFHYTGDFDSMLALRNVYAEMRYEDRFAIWVGSRMYRGDDIYLLDYWPLDNLNTLGGGASVRLDRFEAAFHMGVNRIADEFQFQTVSVADPFFGAQEVVFMDRQRIISSLGLSYRLLGPNEGPALKIKGYLEAHYLASGSMRRVDTSVEDLPSDGGWAGGLQLGAWGFGERASHANLFLRFSQGLAAYGEMAIPFGFDAQKQTFPRASELVLGLSVNYESGRFGLLGAGYLRRFVDADPNLYDRDDGWEMVLDIRPTVTVAGPLLLAVDVSYQQRYPTGMSPSELELMNPAVFQVAPMLILSPLGQGSYDRPQFRLLYRMAYLNEGALDLYATADPRHDEQVVHYLGVQVEWWYNSSYR